ncbi:MULTISPECIES: NAD-dependent epimerase/dehydratase family protein [Pseudomonas]|jgi:nucleoside-diphosphate-sugar epimerase|uniref:NAD-dependent epimerase/dehydratase family protein n=1 Tax=Pseudomonas beijingensis TaxID=2954101 RepID=A0ABY9FH47_9PSED|nr:MULTISPECIES: NAD-dependent epimerase/dehydratase family protein [unclassified Pseudomonas]WLH02867.1 NAD-dependent epimerase/dehydratase family protein [Pseudomonas sp. FP2034]WLI47699.1 NAD-dependent epimerase/dehydratase family protein [Pseudomonas sp. FP830]
MNSIERVLLTGSTGFVGSRLHAALGTTYSVVATSRSAQIVWNGSQTIGVGDLSSETVWTPALQGVDCVVHVAGRAHKLNDKLENPLAEFRKVNVGASLNLARQASEAGVKRFVFISSIGVHGASTAGKPLDELSPLIPHADYALSKLEAENGLKEISVENGMELVILRPPLIYAGHAPGNFERLLKLVASGLPLPFLGVNNQRSMIALDNLVDLIALCIEHPAAANQSFLVSDGIDVSTPQIIRCLSKGMGREARLFSIPDSLIYRGAELLGRKTTYDQLYGSLAIDSSKARDLLAWTAPITPDEALFRAGKDYISRVR